MVSLVSVIVPVAVIVSTPLARLVKDPLKPEALEIAATPAPETDQAAFVV